MSDSLALPEVAPLARGVVIAERGGEARAGLAGAEIIAAPHADVRGRVL